MKTLITFTLWTAFGVCLAAPPPPTTETRPPIHPTNALNQPHQINIRADDWGADAKRFSVTIRAKNPKVPLQAASGYLTVQDGDKFVSHCEVRAEHVGADFRFEFGIGTAYLDKSQFGFGVTSATEKERKKMSACPGGWDNYAFTLRDFVPGSSPISVAGQRLTFDPNTCTEGTGMFFWGNGSVRVTVLGHKDGHCVFDYQWEVEGAGNHLVHRLNVPTNSGPVVIDAERRETDGAHQWSIVFTSFTEQQATLIRRASFGWLEDLVEGTGEFVAYRAPQRGSLDQPATTGEKMTLQFTVYADETFKKPLAGAKPEQVTLTVGQGEDWKWVRVASAGMAPGEIRQVRLPAKIAEDAKGWLSGVEDGKTIFLKMERTAMKQK